MYSPRTFAALQVHPIQGRSFSGAQFDGSFAFVSSNEKIFRHKWVKIGTEAGSQEGFCWWPIQGEFDIQRPELLGLDRAPGVGDVMTYSNTTVISNHKKTIWMFRDTWTNITQEYLSNLGPDCNLLLHPYYPASDQRVLTWKNVSNQEPTYIKASGFSKKLKDLEKQEVTANNQMQIDG
jgi:hypothetical protein